MAGSAGQDSSTFSHPTLTTTAQQIPTMCNATFNNTESVLSDHSSNETGAHLVDFATTAMGWSAYPSAHAHHLSVHGRVRYGLGHSLWQLSLLWSLVLSKTPFPYKLQETPSCGQSPTTGATIVLGSHPVMYGQHVCHGIYQQIRRYPLLQPEHLGNGHMALLLSELNTIINTIRSIPLQPSDASSCQFAHQTEWTLPRRTFLWLKRLWVPITYSQPHRMHRFRQPLYLGITIPKRCGSIPFLGIGPLYSVDYT